MRVEIRLDPHSSFTGVVDHLQAELLVDGCLVFGRGVDQGAPEVAQTVDQALDLVLAQPLRPSSRPRLGECFGAACLSLGHPPSDQLGVGPRFQRGSVTPERLVALLDDPHSRQSCVFVIVRGLGFIQRVDRVFEPMRREGLREPRIERSEQVTLGEIDVARMLHLVRQTVLSGKPAPVEQHFPALLPLHAPTAQSAPHQPAQDVPVARALPLPRRAARSPGPKNLLRPLERLRIDQRLMHKVIRQDPFVPRVPPHPRLVTQRDVLDVDQDLVLALLVPHLTTGIARVRQDHPHRTLRPRDARPMPIACSIVG
nr:hypothetical protein [Amycolatopsis deserti]